MRYLNKIVFINSAHIRYAEIQLDGNVHFIGTQGVGKSTLLRALLFFYNADKIHLGIKAEQATFDEFYFENSNSYIIYEVLRETGAYTILTYKHQGRAAFRFIDAPYQKDWFISETGEVLSDWVKIRQNITKEAPVDIMKPDSYEEYKDIIFGNLHDSRLRKFAKYSIVESTKYQNIPRSIQNVFLNSKLDAEFVKKTIIESMTDGDVEDAIKLSVYRNLVNQFEREYDDIQLWYKKDRNGDILIRRQADQVIASYHDTVAYEQQIRRSIRELNFAIQQAQEQLPILQEDLKQTDEFIVKEKQKQREANEEFQSERSSLNRQLGAIEDKLKTIRAKCKHYAEINIEAMLSLNQTESKLRQDRQKEQEILDALTKQFADIETKYKNLLAQLDISHERFLNYQETQLNKLREEIRKQRETDIQEKQNQLAAAETRYHEACDEIDKKIEALTLDKAKIDSKIQEARVWQPYQVEKQSLLDEILQLAIEEKEAGANQKAKEQEIERLRTEAQLAEEKAENEYKSQDEQLQVSIQKLQEELDQVNTLLSNYKGSLYEWLAQSNLPWEETIGKVVDEERVLYAQGLSPELVATDNTLFGVQLDLSQIESTHRSPDDYRKRQKELNEHIGEIKKQRVQILQTKELSIKKIREQLSSKISPLQQEVTNYRVRLQQIPQQKRDKQTQLDTHIRKENEVRQAKLAELQQELEQAILNLSQARNEKEAKRALWEKDKKQINAVCDKKGKELEQKITELKSKQATERKEEEESYTKQQRLIEAEREAELKGKGANTEIIRKQEEIIRYIDKQLQTIENQRATVIGYLKDKEELFDKEDSFKQEKKALDEKMANLQSVFEEKARKIANRLKELQEQRDKQDKKITEWQEGISQYNQIINIEHLLTDTYLQEEKCVQTTKSCQVIIAELRGAINDKKRKQEDLKRSVNTFNSHFTPDNIFHFNTTPVYDEDYNAIALSLQEFIENNKIELFRRRTSELYQNILVSVSREVGNLMNHQSQIETVIRDINRDFQEKQFAGVIKSIELRAEQSDDSMMRLLQRIKEFYDENSLNMGTANLFSEGNNEEVNKKVVDYLAKFVGQLQKDSNKQALTLSDTFNLQFRVKENDHDTGWVERINNVGSDGTDILVKAMINIMLINVFKNKASRNKNQDFIIHCMMDEIGKLHPNNIQGILNFANTRNIYLVNSSPMSYNAYDYRYTYMLTKDQKSMTIVTRLLKKNDTE